VLQLDNYNLFTPKFVKKVVIDPTKQQTQAENSSNGNGNNLINIEVPERKILQFWFFLIPTYV